MRRLGGSGPRAPGGLACRPRPSAPLCFLPLSLTCPPTSPSFFPLSAVPAAPAAPVRCPPREPVAAFRQASPSLSLLSLSPSRRGRARLSRGSHCSEGRGGDSSGQWAASRRSPLCRVPRFSGWLVVPYPSPPSGRQVPPCPSTLSLPRVAAEASRGSHCSEGRGGVTSCMGAAARLRAAEPRPSLRGGGPASPGLPEGACPLWWAGLLSFGPPPVPDFGWTELGGHRSRELVARPCPRSHLAPAAPRKRKKIR